MRCYILPGIVGAVLVSAFASGCKGDGGGSTGSTPPADISGAWTEVEVLTDAANAITCSDTGTVTITETGATFTGSTVQTGTCQTPGGPVDNGGTLSLVGGTISGSTINFTEPGSGVPCTYRGTLYHTPPDSVAGTVGCSGGGINAVGTWRMTQ